MSEKERISNTWLVVYDGGCEVVGGWDEPELTEAKNGTPLFIAWGRSGDNLSAVDCYKDFVLLEQNGKFLFNPRTVMGHEVQYKVAPSFNEAHIRIERYDCQVTVNPNSL